MKKILCFGDSNTWGFMPDVSTRYPDDVRWTGVCRKELGEGYRVIEDGLNGRTTVYDDPWMPNRKGSDAIAYSVLSDYPLDLVVLALGTNDLKFVNADYSARGAARLIQMLQGADSVFGSITSVFPNGTKILLVSPILLHKDIDKINPTCNLYHAYGESCRFREYFEAVAKTAEVDFINAADYGWPSDKDGVHMDPEAHAALGKAMAAKIREILG